MNWTPEAFPLTSSTIAAGDWAEADLARIEVLTKSKANSTWTLRHVWIMLGRAPLKPFSFQ